MKIDRSAAKNAFLSSPFPLITYANAGVKACVAARVAATVALGFGLVLAPGSHEAIAQTAQPTATLVSDAGSPLKIVFSNGNEAEYWSVVSNEPLVSKLTLNENACRPLQKATCEIRFPRRTQRTVLKWVKHPERQGQLVKMNRGNRQGAEKQYRTHLMTQVQFDFARLKQPAPAAEADRAGAELTCDSNEWMSWANGSAGSRRSMIVGWDEDLESSNSEFLYYQGNFDERPSFNAIINRFEGIPAVERAGNRIALGTPDALMNRTGGFFVFPLIAYSIQLTFASPSLADPMDRMCQVKLTNDFTRVFTDVTGLFSFNDAEPQIDVTSLKPVLAGSPEDSMLNSYDKDATQWSYRDIQ